MDHSPPDFESSHDAFPVKLDNFDGPLDLLLYLIRRNEVNIYDIPIVLITQQYLDAIRFMQELNLDVAGDFLVMAATLIHIKSKLLLPRPETATMAEGGAEEDPRDALVRRLLEHERYKAAAGLLHERELVRAAQWPRPDERVADIAGERIEPELEVDLFSLLHAFQAVIERARQRPKVMLPPEQVPLEIRIGELLSRLSETEACGFEELFADAVGRRGLIVTFLALLEMIRLKLVRVFQSGSFGPIRVYKRERPADAPHPIGDPEANRG
jgi:segregation and condensation protein A